ncbi:beta-phosphoglucomutase family hydrolase [Arthrobacter crystallopoietes]|uniref:beta-phosphoglucomutase family hydrolase n=1 Tax=Crystallibacter crystallopoietes TaxID=37928 RepID=UPI0011112586|nr:beta-phosphoglucomutase family hydrolase [Arthrobacter crystallopoietes]
MPAPDPPGGSRRAAPDAGLPVPVPRRWTGSPTVAGTLSPFDAVIFDLDGVITDTASVHRTAWKQLFDTVLTDARIPQTSVPVPFRDNDYYTFIDGRPREQGILAFLESRRIDLPPGSPADPPGTWTVAGLGASKNALFLDELHRHGVRTFPGTVDLINRLHQGRVPVAVVSSSRNAPAVLAAAGLEGLFDTVVDGSAAAELQLPGKPHPATFLEAARRMKVRPRRTAVVEDAAAGITAARRGGFGLIVGIDRTSQRGRLEDAGADMVLHDVSELDIGLVLTHAWRLVYDGFDPSHEGHREALTTLGNGRMATRGAAPETREDTIHYPGTYLAGTYNRLPQLVNGEETEGEHMVNLANWLPLDLRFGTGGWWSEGGLALRRERRELDLKQAVLSRRVLLEDGHGHQLDVAQRRIVSMAQPNLALLETTLTARGWNGPVQIRTGIDTDVRNGNVTEDAALGNRHLTGARTAVDGGIETAETLTSQSHVRVAAAVRISFHGPAGAPAAVRSSENPSPPSGTGPGNGSPWLQSHHAELSAGVPLAVCKTAAIVSSRDRAISSPLSGARAVLARTPAGFGPAFAAHKAAWQRLLDLFTFDLHADRENQLVLNLHIFHLLQTLTPHTAELDAGVPARGLHGEGYRGHIFWDELFVLPLITARLPQVTRSLLDYRWRRLDAARDAARAAGLAGAMFPWRSGSDGTEETPRWLYNRFSGQWMPDHSHLQRHGSLAVAYNAWQYFEATTDRDWLLGHGAEIIVEVARLFASLAEADGPDGRFHIRGVMGPDEYHDGYPDHPEKGLDDNAYTNVMAAWVCSRPAKIMDAVRGRDRRDLRNRLGITGTELQLWDQLGRFLYVPFHDGMISQFDGYGRLQELDWEHYRRTYGNIERLDLILAAEGDSTNRYKLSKQADVLMLLYVLGEDQLVRGLRRMGYDLTAAQLAHTVDYYLARTVHGSTLSRVAHASVLAASDPERAWATFRDALDADLDDTQGGTTRTGVHLGAMAGTIDVIQRSFAGLRMSSDTLIFTPRLPSELGLVSFRIRYRGQLLDITLEHATLRVEAAEGTAAPVRIRVGTDVALLEPGGTVELEYG